MSEEKQTFVCPYCKKEHPIEQKVNYGACLLCEDRVFDALMEAQERRVDRGDL